MVYTRPLPTPARSERSWSVLAPVMFQSGAVLPSPSPLTGSLLCTDEIAHTGVPQLSDATQETATAFILWLGAQSVFGLADTFESEGAVTSGLQSGDSANVGRSLGRNGLEVASTAQAETTAPSPSDTMASTLILLNTAGLPCHFRQT